MPGEKKTASYDSAGLILQKLYSQLPRMLSQPHHYGYARVPSLKQGPSFLSEIKQLWEGTNVIIYHKVIIIIRCNSVAWRDGSVVKSTGCFSRGPGYNSQHLHDGSPPHATPAPENLMPSSGLCTSGSMYADIYAGKTPIHIKYKISKESSNLMSVSETF